MMEEVSSVLFLRSMLAAPMLTFTTQCRTFLASLRVFGIDSASATVKDTGAGRLVDDDVRKTGFICVAGLFLCLNQGCVGWHHLDEDRMDIPLPNDTCLLNNFFFF